MLVHLERTERPWCKQGSKNAQVIIDCLVSGVLDAADVKEEVLKRQKTGEFADLVPHLKLFPNHERAGVIFWAPRAHEKRYRLSLHRLFPPV
jgi:hypothetical protein